MTKKVCPGIWEETSFSAQTIWVITALQPLWMKNCWWLTTSFLLASLTPASHSSGSSFINSFRLVSMFGMQDKFVPNSWTCCKGTLSAAVSTGSETTRCCLMNGGICGNYWSFHRAYRGGGRQWTLMNRMLWSFMKSGSGVELLLPSADLPTWMTHTVF